MQDIIKKELLTEKLVHIESPLTNKIKSTWLAGKKHDHISNNDLKEKSKQWFFSNKINQIHGLDSFPYIDFIYGCTDYINNFLIKQKTYQILEEEYSYYSLFGKQQTKPSELQDNVPVIVSLPNWHYGNKRPDWNEFLKICEEKNIDIHIDAAWYTATNNFNLELDHPNIKSIAVSMTKMGFDWNKFGIKMSKKKTIDAITIRDSFGWINQNVLNCANFIMDNIDVGHHWNYYGKNYFIVCHRLNLQRTNFIHVAKKDGKNVGVANILKNL